jgi:hypothetical protein
MLWWGSELKKYCFLPVKSVYNFQQIEECAHPTKGTVLVRQGLSVLQATFTEHSRI